MLAEVHSRVRFKEHTVTANQSATGGTRQREVRTLVDNRQARHLYHIEDTYQAGMILEGWEVKAMLAGQANFNGGSSFVRMVNGEAFLDALTVTPLPYTDVGLLVDRKPTRLRKLLMNKAELRKLDKRVRENGYTIVPLALTLNGKIKLQLGLAKGKKQHDKRDTLKQRDVQRDIDRAMKAAK
jgi:SsrA-binding protein